MALSAGLLFLVAISLGRSDARGAEREPGATSSQARAVSEKS